MINQSMYSQALISSLAILLSGVASFYILFFILRHFAKKKVIVLINLLNKHIHLESLLLFISIIAFIVLKKFKPFILSQSYENLSQFVKIMLIVSIGVFIMKLVGFLKNSIINHFEKGKYKDYALRSAKSKYELLQRIGNVFIALYVFVAVLTTFPHIKKIGGALVASAGVVGIVVGLAAQKGLGSLFAGIKIAIAHSIKLDDKVIVEDTFGTVGEITPTYIVINTWDDKRLFVPVSYFLENRLKNLT